MITGHWDGELRQFDDPIPVYSLTWTFLWRLIRLKLFSARRDHFKLAIADYAMGVLDEKLKVGDMVFPNELTPALDDALGLMIMQTCPLAHLRRDLGEDIPRKTEREHARVLFWAIKLALTHGDNWRHHAQEEIKGLIAEAKQRSKT